MTCLYQDLFPDISDAIHQWNEKNAKFKKIKPNTLSGKENDRCGKDETVINRLRAGHTILTHGYLMEGLPVPECDMCCIHAML